VTKTVKPLNDKVVAKMKKEENKIAGGLYLPDSAKEKPSTAIVESVGPNVKEVKVGDEIIFKSYSTTEFEDFIILKEEDIIATVK
jgi:chaperonin GroES